MQKLLNRPQAIFLGLASMIGAGVFGVFGPAARLAGNLLYLSIALAGLVAFLNAASISQLAKVVTRSGGAYSYARHYLSDAWGFAAGSAFLIGKIGSAAAIALTVSSYITPGTQVLTAVLAIAMMATLNILGVNRTAFGAMVLASITIGFLSLVFIASLGAPSSSEPLEAGGFLGVLSAASLMFFAFAGYARVASLGGEVKNPSKSIPVAIAASLSLTFVIYLFIGLASARVLGADLAFSLTPIGDLASEVIPWLPSGVVSIVAGGAALGSLLALLAGMGRTAATMAEDGELPKVLARRNAKGAPFISELIIGALAILLVFFGGVETNIGVSSFAVLTYYAIANFAAFRQPKSESSRLKILNLAGLSMCALLAFSVPFTGLLIGISALLIAVTLRFGIARLRQNL